MSTADKAHGRLRGAAVLQPDRTRAIRRAAVVELAHGGYGRLTVDAVAKRAGVGKAALYRRWRNKEEMVLALLAGMDFEIVEAANTGSLEGDVRDYVDKAFRLLRRPLARRILPDLYAEVGRDTALAAAIRQAILVPKRGSVNALLDRAIARGEVDDPIDRDLAFDLLIGPIYWRALVTGASADDTVLWSMANAITRAIKRTDG